MQQQKPSSFDTAFLKAKDIHEKNRNSHSSYMKRRGKKKIIMIDDDSTFLEVAKEFFKQIGEEVITCVDPLHFMKLIAANNIRCIIIDKNMPMFNGLEILKHVEDERCKKIIVSSDPLVRDEVPACASFVQKNSEMKDFVNEILHLISA